MERGKFIRVKCSNCKNEQVIFGKASTEAKCLVCGNVLAAPVGGKANVKAKVLEVL
ncbi:MAG: 30S ribosomal protein S27e [Nanoarchaeota archaeon]|nr:30S ribosomal protein S27e [Nanoarchaeota archaeon]